MKHNSPISGIAAHAGRYIATAGYDNQVILWDAGTQISLHRVFHDHLANQCAFSPDGSLLASASSDYSVRLWHVPSMRLCAVLAGHTDDVEMAVFSPDGTRVASCSRDLTVRIFGLDGTCLGMCEGHTGDVISVGWSADGHSLISSSDDGTVRRWDAASGSELERIDVGGVETDTLCVSRSGIIFAGDDEGRISLISNGQVERIRAHEAGIKRIVWDDERRWLISLSYDRTVMLWRLDDSDRLERIASSALPSVIWPRSCAFLDADRVVFATFGSSYATWNLVSDEWDVSQAGHTQGVNAVATRHSQVHAIGDAGVLWIDQCVAGDMGSLCNFFVPLGEGFLTGGQMGKVFDTRTGLCIHQHRSPLNCGVAFDRDDGPHAIIGTYTGEGLVFRLDNEGCPQFVCEIPMHNNAIKDLAADATHLFSVCANADAAWHRIGDYGLERKVEKAHARISNGCTRTADGFASVGRDLTLRLWRNGVAETFPTPHHHSIKCVAASGEGTCIATGGYDGTIGLFDLPSRTYLGTVRPTASGISSLTPGLAAGEFLAGSYDGQVYRVCLGRGDRHPVSVHPVSVGPM